MLAASAALAASVAFCDCAAADVLSLPVNSDTAATGAQSLPVYTFSLTGATNYFFRGVSQTENNVDAFGLARVDYDGFYAAAGAEHVDFHNSIDAEYDLYLGWKPSLYGLNSDLGAVRWGYVDEPAHVSIDTVELKGAVSHPFGPVTLGAVVYFAPDYSITRNLVVDLRYYDTDEHRLRKLYDSHFVAALKVSS